MVLAGSLQLSHELGFCRNHRSNKQFKLRRQDFWRSRLSENFNRPMHSVPSRIDAFKCHSFQVPSQVLELPAAKAVSTAFTRSCNFLQGSPVVFKMAPAVGIILFSLWGLMPLVRQSRSLLLHKGDNGWKKSSTHYVTTSYIQPLLLWTGAILICRALDPLVLPTAASQIVKQRLLNFVRSLSTVLAFAYCLSSLIEQTQKFFTETSDPSDARNMGFQFAGKAVYSAVWVAAVSLFMELLGFSTQKWLTAGGLGTVLLTLAGREIFTNFLSSAMIHATRPFVVNEWIQTKIEGYDVSGTVEHVGWWSPTIVRGEDREAVHIPNHKFTMNVVRNLSQKTHWRIKTHLAISHLDVNKINNIVADMRKVLAKNPHVEQQRLHRRVFLDNINHENQALLIMVSCFVKTSHFEEYLRVKETILLDLLRVISHHRARLATPIRTVQKIYSDADLENVPFADSIYSRGAAASNRPLLLIEPSYKISGEDKAKSRSSRTTREQDGKTTLRATSVSQADPKAGATVKSESKSKGTPTSEGDTKIGEPPTDNKVDLKASSASISDSKAGDKVTVRPTSKSAPKTSSDNVEMTSSYPMVLDSVSANSAQNTEIADSKQQRNANLENVKQSRKSDSPALSLPETDDVEKAVGLQETSQSTQEGERSPTSQPAASRPATLEENIVLGVALEGSKRTLPIEEGMASPSTTEVKELAAARRNGNGSPSEKDKKDGQIQATPNSSADQ